MAVWFIHGYPDPQNGTALDYWMNAVSRVASQLVLVAVVAPQDPIRLLAARVRGFRRSLSAHHRGPSLPSPTGPVSDTENE